MTIIPWAAITLVVVIGIVLAIHYFLGGRIAEEESPSKREEESPEVRVYGGTCRPGDLCIEGYASAKPEGTEAQERAHYTGRSVTTSGHPFLITEGGATYIPVQNWWAMNGTYGACVGVISDTIFFLCEHGLYASNRDVAIRLSDNSIGHAQITSIHTYRGSAYAIASHKLYRLFSSTEYQHLYGSVPPSKSIVDLSHLSKDWLLDCVQYINGRDISQASVRKMTVVSDVLYLDLDGDLMQYRTRWTRAAYMIKKGHYCHQSKGSTQVWTLDGSLVRTSKGVGTFIGTIPILYSISDNWLSRNGQDTGGKTIRLSRGWNGLMQLEDGRLLGIASGETYTC